MWSFSSHHRCHTDVADVSSSSSSLPFMLSSMLLTTTSIPGTTLVQSSLSLSLSRRVFSRHNVTAKLLTELVHPLAVSLFVFISRHFYRECNRYEVFSFRISIKQSTEGASSSVLEIFGQSALSAQQSIGHSNAILQKFQQS